MLTTNRRGAGFTLLEVLVVVSILGMLSAIAIAAYTTYLDKGKYAQAYEDLRTIRVAIAKGGDGKVVRLTAGRAEPLVGQRAVARIRRLDPLQRIVQVDAETVDGLFIRPRLIVPVQRPETHAQVRGRRHRGIEEYRKPLAPLLRLSCGSTGSPTT